MATKSRSRSKFSPLKKRSDEIEAGEFESDHKIMNISYTTSSSRTFKEDIMKHNVFSQLC